MARPPSMLNVSVAELERLLADRRRDLRRLDRQRVKWQRKLDAVERQILAMGGAPGGRRGGGGGGGGRRPRNGVSLPDAIEGVLSRGGSALGVGEIAEKVLAGGYRSSSANFRSIVNQALIKDRRFVSEARGVYRLRGSAQARRTPGTAGGKRRGRRAMAPAENSPGAET